MSAPLSVSTHRGRFVFLAQGDGRYGFHLEVLGTNGWRRVTALNNSLVTGPAFDICPDEVRRGIDCLDFTAINESRDGMQSRWTGSVRPLSRDGHEWFCVSLEVDSKGFRIGDHGSVEPQVIVDLGPLPPYERGDHVWFKTLVQNPTQWNGEGRGNDFPALAYVDPYLHARFRMFFDVTPMSWMGADTIARFYTYECGFRRRFDGRPSAEIGLLADVQSGHRFPPGKQVFSWYLSVEEFTDESPSEQDELCGLVDACLPLLPTKWGSWPGDATSWAEIAAGCARDLMDTDHAWGGGPEGEYLLAYVDGRSDAWDAAMSARGRSHEGDEACLEAALWALRPLEQLRAALPRQDPHSALRARLELFIRAELNAGSSALLTGRTSSPLLMGTWQYMYMLSETWLLFAHRDDEIRRALLNEIQAVAVPLAHNTQYLFPLQFDRSTLRKAGPGSAYAVAGTYALLMIDLADSDHREYLDEAMRALRALANVPIDHALQEVILIAHALDAADRLAHITGDPEWAHLREYFRAQTLRMMYWYDDRTSSVTSQSSHLGMFLACANIGYPAFFENIETDVRLAASIAGEVDPTATLRVLDYGRRTNFSFFPRCSPDMYGSMPLDYIPFEDVPIFEGPNDAGFLGQEIYGAGFTFRAHLLWDACAYAVDREVMVVSLDSHREHPEDQGWIGKFLLSNTSGDPVHTEIVFPLLETVGGLVTVTWPTGESIQHRLPASGTFPLMLPEHGWLHMTVHRDRIGQ